MYIHTSTHMFVCVLGNSIDCKSRKRRKESRHARKKHSKAPAYFLRLQAITCHYACCNSIIVVKKRKKIDTYVIFSFSFHFLTWIRLYKTSFRSRMHETELS